MTAPDEPPDLRVPDEHAALRERGLYRDAKAGGGYTRFNLAAGDRFGELESEEQWSPSGDDESRIRQRLASLYPLASETHQWECVDCKAWFWRGLGCVDCREPVCSGCVRAESHRCAEYAESDEQTLAEIGASLAGDLDTGVCVERTRQIQNRALEKLRHHLRIVAGRRGESQTVAYWLGGT